jgi:hypothetical protein
MSAPMQLPSDRPTAKIAAPETYRPGALVWVHRSRWCPGVVLDASDRAVMVRYNPHGRAVGVDTVLADQLAHRDESELIDEALRGA